MLEITRTLEQETAAYWGLMRDLLDAKRLDNEKDPDDALADLSGLAMHGVYPAIRTRAAATVAQHRFWERLQERETARLDAALDGLAVALANKDWRRFNDFLGQLQTIAYEALAETNREAAKRAIARHFQSFDHKQAHS